MSEYILIIILSGIFSLNSFSQNIETYFETQKPVPFQKLYLQTDREFFFEGDTLWFAAYLVNGQAHIISEEDCNLYVDIINGKGELVQDELYLIQNGSTAGNVNLNKEKISEGKYLIRAYTDYLKNFGNDAFFTKNIRVSAVKNSFEFEKEASKQQGANRVTKSSPDQHKVDNSIHQLNSKSAGERRNIDVSFLPEGGFLLAGQSNCVAFKAIDENGMGVDVSGKLFDKQDSLVLTFKSLYKGAGKFYFFPKSGKKYIAKIDGWPGITFSLPAAKQNGAKIKLVNQETEKLQLLVQSEGGVQNAPYHLSCLQRGRALFYMKLDESKLNSLIRINSNQLGSGINRFVLLDKNMNPVSERLIFQNNVKLNQLDVQVGGEAYSTREEIQLNIKPSDNIQNEPALVSVSVVDENYTNASGLTENIASYLLINSELKGYIESPAAYLLDEERISAQTKLDVLMCTNGWSNYRWNSLLPGNVTLKFEAQFGFDFKGKATRAIGKKGLEEGNVFFMVKNKNTTQFLDMPLREDGSFEFREVVFYDSASVFAQGRNKRDKHTIEFDLKFPNLNRPAIDKSRINSISSYSQIPVSIYRQRYTNEMKLREFYPDRHSILVDEVEVKGKSYLETWKTGVVRKGNGPYLLTTRQTAGSPDIIRYLQYKVPGIWPSRGGQSIKLSPGSGRIDEPEPVFWIDYHLMLTVDDIRSYSIDMFETIEILNPPMSYFYRAPGGVILLTTKTGRTLNETKANLMGGAVKTLKGFTPVREFYSPKYTTENIQSEVPDFRNTLYWNPHLILRGEHEIYFNACDNVSRYRVVVEGITETGKICIGETKFEVNSISQVNR